MSPRPIDLPDPPPSLPAADAEALRRLAHDAVVRQRHEVRVALDEALDRVPRLLRPAVKAVVGR